MMNNLIAAIQSDGSIPLAFAGSTLEMNYLNYGDALSPVMVALFSSLEIHRVPTRSKNVRLGAVGTIGHGFEKGETFFWGSGSSKWRNPSAPLESRELFRVPDASIFNVCATRGPLSRDLLGGGAVPFCDPVWALPEFYNPAVERKYELGIILHLSELDGRSLDAGPKREIVRAHIPDSLTGSIRVINTITGISSVDLGRKTDEILSCKRILSTSLHGLVIAESYGIPCLYFGNDGSQTGLMNMDILSSCIDMRMQDLYMGLDETELPIYFQPKGSPTDFDAAMKAIDLAWQLKASPTTELEEASPFPVNRLQPPSTGSIWEHPLIQGLPYQSDVAALRRADAEKAHSR